MLLCDDILETAEEPSPNRTKYTYDDLTRLATMTRGSAVDGVIADPTYTQFFGLDGLGNMASVTGTDPAQTRTVNAANEIVGATGMVTPVYDAAGNMTFGPRGDDATTGLAFKYDAWNRLTKVYSDTSYSDNSLIATYAYDGRGRRISKTVGEDRYDYYYNENWQILEIDHAVGTGESKPSQQFVWDPRYIDAPVLVKQDTNGDGTLDRTLYYTQDANFNVTALIDASLTTPTVVERDSYTSYGHATVYDANWTERTTSAYGNVLMYGGYRYDLESGLYETRARLYNPTLGTFIIRDPKGYAAGMNLTGYCGDRPGVATDPTGLAPDVGYAIGVGSDFFGQTGFGTGVVNPLEFQKQMALQHPPEDPIEDPFSVAYQAGLLALQGVGNTFISVLNGFLNMPDRREAALITGWSSMNPYGTPLDNDTAMLIALDDSPLFVNRNPVVPSVRGADNALIPMSERENRATEFCGAFVLTTPIVWAIDELFGVRCAETTDLNVPTLSKELRNVGFKEEITLKMPPDTPGLGLRRMASRIVDGKIRRPLVRGTLGSYKGDRLDFVITKDGSLVVGKGHSVLSNGENVAFAGQLKFNGNGELVEITNQSGHYKPATGQGLTEAAKQHVKNLGVDVSKAIVNEVLVQP